MTLHELADLSLRQRTHERAAAERRGSRLFRTGRARVRDPSQSPNSKWGPGRCSLRRLQRVQFRLFIGAAVPVVLRTQLDPLAVKKGSVAVPEPLAVLNPFPVMAAQIALASVAPRLTSRPFSLSPVQVATVAVELVLVQVRIAPRTS